MRRAVFLGGGEGEGEGRGEGGRKGWSVRSYVFRDEHGEKNEEERSKKKEERVEKKV